MDSENKNNIFTTEERIKQYHDVLQWLLEYCDCKKYVICDFSGFEKEFASYKQYGKIVEYISFISSRKNDKSYGETEILYYILKNSKLVSESKYIFKLTGRIYVKNINTLIKTCDTKKKLFSKSLVADRGGADKNNLFLCECNTVFFGSPKMDLINAISCFKDEVSDSNNIEKCFYDTFKKLDIKIFSFAREPLFVGVSAATGFSYAINFKKWFVYNFLSILRLKDVVSIIVWKKKYNILNL